jgi:hypothetical protein
VNTVSVLSADSTGVSVIPISAFALLLTAWEFYSIFKIKNFAWILSALQVPMIFFTSVGTFGYFFEVTLSSFVHD